MFRSEESRQVTFMSFSLGDLRDWELRLLGCVVGNFSLAHVLDVLYN